MRSKQTVTVVATFAASVALVGCGDGKKKTTTCDLAAPSCDAGFICLDDGTGAGVCEEICDPGDTSTCEADQVCNAVAGDAFGCFDPVYVEGRVTDSSSGAGVSGAQVMAADSTGQVVTTIVTTDANGDYRLLVPVTRDRSGNLISSTFTLRVAAADYQTFPSGTRPAIPVATSSATFDMATAEFTIQNATTSVSLIDLQVTGLKAISGAVGGAEPGGALVVAECASPPCPYSYADTDGNYTIFNVPNGSYTVAAYKADLDVGTAAATMAGADLTGVDLAAAAGGVYTVTGSINPVESAGATSVVLIPASTFESVPVTLSDNSVLNDVVVRGAVAPGLRAPEPGIAPNITNPYTIAGVPSGRYVVLAGFENDFVCRDPDASQGGTALVVIDVPADIAGGGTTLTVGQSFKVNPALDIVSPGANEPQAVASGTSITFQWANDSGEDHYELFLFDALGNEIWTSTAAMNQTSLAYGGPALTVGMYYQWKVISIATNWNAIAISEDLRGVFYVTP